MVRVPQTARVPPTQLPSRYTAKAVHAKAVQAQAVVTMPPPIMMPPVNVVQTSEAASVDRSPSEKRESQKPPKPFMPECGAGTEAAAILEKDVLKYLAEAGTDGVDMSSLGNVTNFLSRFQMIFFPLGAPKKRRAWTSWLESLTGVKTQRSSTNSRVYLSASGHELSKPLKKSTTFEKAKEKLKQGRLAHLKEKALKDDIFSFLSREEPMKLDRLSNAFGVKETWEPKKTFGCRFKSLFAGKASPRWSSWLLRIDGISLVNGVVSLETRKRPTALDGHVKDGSRELFIPPLPMQSNGSMPKITRRSRSRARKREKHSRNSSLRKTHRRKLRRSRSKDKHRHKKRKKSRSKRRRSRSKRKRSRSRSRRKKKNKKDRPTSKRNKSKSMHGRRRRHRSTSTSSGSSSESTESSVPKPGQQPSGEQFDASTALTLDSRTQQSIAQESGASTSAVKHPSLPELPAGVPHESESHSLAALVDDKAVSDACPQHADIMDNPHNELEEWLVKMDDGRGVLTQYKESILLHFGSLPELAASVTQQLKPGVSVVQCVDVEVFEALGVRALGHKLILAKAILTI